MIEVSRVFFCTAMAANRLRTNDMAKKPFSLSVSVALISPTVNSRSVSRVENQHMPK